MTANSPKGKPMTKEPSAGERYRRNLSEMKDHVFVEALQCAINPMDEELMRQLCLEAVDRLAAIRDSDAELVAAAKAALDLLEADYGLMSCESQRAMLRKALARHNADKGEV